MLSPGEFLSFFSSPVPSSLRILFSAAEEKRKGGWRYLVRHGRRRRKRRRRNTQTVEKGEESNPYNFPFSLSLSLSLVVGRGGGGKTFDEKGSGTNSHSLALFLLSPTEADSFPFSGLGDKSSENGIVLTFLFCMTILWNFRLESLLSRGRK